jgi:hypothetical protein
MVSRVYDESSLALGRGPSKKNDGETSSALASSDHLERQANGSAEVPHVHAEEDPALTNAQSDMDVHRMYAARSTLNRCALWHRVSP